MGVDQTANQLPDAETVIAEFKKNVSPEGLEEGMAILAEYETLAKEFQEKVIAMRLHHTRFMNGYTDDRETYVKLRDESRVLMNKTFRLALDVIGFMPHPDAAQYVVTMIEQRYNHDVYDSETFEGAAKLLDHGVRWKYVVLAAARSAMVVGDFQLAENIYKNVDPEELDDKDRAMMGMADVIKEQFKKEQELLENDPDDLPQVRILTTRGEIVADLFINEAPSTVAHFITLVESGFYDGLDFFQVIDGLLALTGDPLGDGSTRPDRFLADEHGREVVRMPLAGSLVIAKLPDPSKRFVPNTAGTQFAMLFMPLPKVAEQQTVFGRITKGMDVLGALRRVDPHKEKEKGAVVVPPDRIIKCEILNRPETLPEAIYVDSPFQMPALAPMP